MSKVVIQKSWKLSKVRCTSICHVLYLHRDLHLPTILEVYQFARRRCRMTLGG